MKLRNGEKAQKGSGGKVKKGLNEVEGGSKRSGMKWREGEKEGIE
jgi:hypothetical protein